MTKKHLAAILWICICIASAAIPTSTAVAQVTIVISPPQTIQSGIDRANPLDTVLVLPGVYNEDIDFKGKDIFVRTPPGGFVGATIKGTGTDSVVKIVSGESRTALLEGFEITGGVTTGSTSYGGGIRVQGASPTIRRCHIHDNTAAGQGGGIGGYTVNVTVPTSPLIEQCLIENNSGTVSFGGGGAIAFADGRTTGTGGDSIIRDCILRNNTGVSRGGAFYSAYNNNTTIENCLVVGNKLTGGSTSGLNGGGAFYFGLNSKATVVNTMFCQNSAAEGGAIKIFNNSGIRAVNCSFFDNPGGAVAAFNNGGVFNTPTDITLTNCAVWKNGTTEFISVMTGPSQPQINVDYTAITTGATAGVGVTFGPNNIFQDPLFANPLHCNLRLRTGSPCIGKGLNTASGIPAQDIDGDARIIGGTVDMGADEFNPIGAILYHDRGLISVAAPGTIRFEVETTPNYNLKPCAIVPSLSGIWPGFDIGPLHVPLNLDVASSLYFLLAVDATGHAGVTVPLTGIGSSAIGLELHLAAAVGGIDAVTNWVSVEFVQ